MVETYYQNCGGAASQDFERVGRKRGRERPKDTWNVRIVEILN